ncbi:MAG: nucleotidyltransferase substrate binding protein [Bdellovibrionaceae bacterium]|nr:nucleotidyltransferase substrate binding protein [Pseudobdellovibrionaceae bacterium]
MATVSIQEYEKALKTLREALDLYNKEQDPKLQSVIRDGLIQRFEFCIELAWKTSLKTLGLTNRPPKPAIRDMAQGGLVDDVDLWFCFVDARNKSSHTYDEEIAKEVLSSVIQFLPEGERLCKALQSR